MENSNEVLLEVPIALQSLIRSNNSLLKTYQAQLMSEIQDANTQMMNILQLNPSAGWKLDLERMVYTRPKEEASVEEPSVEG